MDMGYIKEMLWTNVMDKKYGEVHPPPSTVLLRRLPQMIRDFFTSCLTQRRGLCDKIFLYKDDKPLRSL
jgi:hypothetical protein